MTDSLKDKCDEWDFSHAPKATDSLKERLAGEADAPLRSAELGDLLREALARIEELEAWTANDLKQFGEDKATIAKLEGELAFEQRENVANAAAYCEAEGELTKARDAIATLQGKLDRAREGLQMIAAMPNSDLDTPASIARSILSDLKDETNDR